MGQVYAGITLKNAGDVTLVQYGIHCRVVGVLRTTRLPLPLCASAPPREKNHVKP